MFTAATTDLGIKLEKDYENNFMTRDDITITLDHEEIIELLNDESLLKKIGNAWHYRFYIRQMFLLSIKNICFNNNLLPEESLKIIFDLNSRVTFSFYHEARALVAMAQLEYFIESLSMYELSQMFSGTGIYDDYCAQIAYKEYKSRIKD